MTRFFFLLWLLLPSVCGAQINAPVYIGARATALGGHYLTLTGADAVLGNVAGTARLEQTAIAVGTERRFGFEVLQQIAAGVAVPTSIGAFGLAVNQTGNRNYAEQRLGLTYARPVAEAMTMGVRFDALRLDLRDFGSTTVAQAELGLQTQVTPTLRVGMTYRQPFTREIIEDETVASQIGLGVDYRVGELALLVLSVEKTEDFPFRVRAGLEYKFTEALLARVGIATGARRPGSTAGGSTEYSFGLGWQFSEQFRLDLGTSRHSILEWTPGLTLIFSQFAGEGN